MYPAPFNLRLPNNDIIIKPDITIICKLSKANMSGWKGVPDIVIEILSPDKNQKYLTAKCNAYEEAGVKEYWIISSTYNTFFRYTLNDEGRFQPTRLMTTGDKVETPVLPGFPLDLDIVFEEYKTKRPLVTFL